MLSPEVFTVLAAVDTPTVCNATELVLGCRTAQGFTTQPMVAAHPSLPAVVGYTRTGLIRSSQPAEESPETLRTRRNAY